LQVGFVAENDELVTVPNQVKTPDPYCGFKIGYGGKTTNGIGISSNDSSILRLY